MAKTAAKTKKNKRWLNMDEPELFEAVQKLFERRGLGGLPLASMVRILLTELVEAKPPRGHGGDSVNR